MKTKIKIAYFIDRLIRGGTELQLVEQINHLNERGVDQELFCLYKSEEHEQIPVACKTKILEIRKLRSLDTMQKVFGLAKYFKKNGFNVIQTYFFDSSIVGTVAGKLCGEIKIIGCRRDLGFWYTPRLILFLRIINRMTTRILVNSKAVKENVVAKEKVNFDHIDVFPNGIDTEKFLYSTEVKQQNRAGLGIKDDCVCIGIIGNMSRKVKRIDLFVKASYRVLQKRSNVKFIILGDGHLKSELMELTRTLGIEDHVKFLGREISKHIVLSAMDVGVLTSDSEGLSNAIIEYMATGIPIVASNVGGNLELIQNGENGYLFNKGDERDLADKLEDLIKDPAKRERYGQRALADIIKFDWKYRTEELLSYYQRILGKEL